MADISMCRDKQCPSRLDCYRFTAKPSQFLQSYASFGRDDGADRCVSFVQATKSDDRQGR